jgi:hypothetical protein
LFPLFSPPTSTAAAAAAAAAAVTPLGNQQQLNRLFLRSGNNNTGQDGQGGCTIDWISSDFDVGGLGYQLSLTNQFGNPQIIVLRIYRSIVWVMSG